MGSRYLAPPAILLSLVSCSPNEYEVNKQIGIFHGELVFDGRRSSAARRLVDLAADPITSDKLRERIVEAFFQELVRGPDAPDDASRFAFFRLCNENVEGDFLSTPLKDRMATFIIEGIESGLFDHRTDFLVLGCLRDLIISGLGVNIRIRMIPHLLDAADFASSVSLSLEEIVESDDIPFEHKIDILDYMVENYRTENLLAVMAAFARSNVPVEQKEFLVGTVIERAETMRRSSVNEERMLFVKIYASLSRFLFSDISPGFKEGIFYLIASEFRQGTEQFSVLGANDTRDIARSALRFVMQQTLDDELTNIVIEGLSRELLVQPREENPQRLYKGLFSQYLFRFLWRDISYEARERIMQTYFSMLNDPHSCPETLRVAATALVDIYFLSKTLPWQKEAIIAGLIEAYDGPNGNPVEVSERALIRIREQTFDQQQIADITTALVDGY